MKISPEVIARASLGLLDQVGLDGLTMRLVARELGVQAPALYWHVKNKQELLDGMAAIVLAEVSDGQEFPPRDISWESVLSDRAWRLRTTLLRHRDGAKMVAGTNVGHPAVVRRFELTLRVLNDAGFPLGDAAMAMSTLLHYTIGFTIEEQARLGEAYPTGENPYRPEALAGYFDPERFPLAAQVKDDLSGTDAHFQIGVDTILTGLRVRLSGR